MATLHAGGQQLPGTFTNSFLAHLQVATAGRFGAGKGFFLTTTVADTDGDRGGTEATFSHWLHPGNALTFAYDVTDESGDRLGPVKLDHKKVDAISAEMDQPNGVRGNDGIWWPFAEGL